MIRGSSPLFGREGVWAAIAKGLASGAGVTPLGAGIFQAAPFRNCEDVPALESRPRSPPCGGLSLGHASGLEAIVRVGSGGVRSRVPDSLHAQPRAVECAGIAETEQFSHLSAGDAIVCGHFVAGSGEAFEGAMPSHSSMARRSGSCQKRCVRGEEGADAEFRCLRRGNRRTVVRGSGTGRVGSSRRAGWFPAHRRDEADPRRALGVAGNLGSRRGITSGGSPPGLKEEDRPTNVAPRRSAPSLAR
jgi:hypothetical protein